MSRALVVLWVTITLALTGIAAAAGAHAQPVPPCAYTLSPPQVVHVDGVAKVTATVTPAGCAGPFRPNMSVACLYLGSQGQCTQGRGTDSAQVYFEPYQPGATYSATGRGCGTMFDFAPAPKCQTLGPITATL